MSKKKKIGWQKYEDIIESQLNSPILETIMDKYLPKHDLEETEDDDTIDEEDVQGFGVPIPISEKLLEDISMLNNFECWMGHTNFDITPKIKDKLNKVEGVELLKIYSRYRFFIGIGKMFDFTSVRQDIDKITIEE